MAEDKEPKPVKEEEEEEQEGEEEETEKWLKYYSSSHQILLVGDGDFSFSSSLANSFVSASNMVTTSLDQYDDLVKKYSKAKSNIESLKKLGATIIHGVDATKMKLHTDLRMRKFDRIIFNFPHEGFHGKEDNVNLIKKHWNLVLGFLKNASCMLRADGEVHVNHKTSPPFNHWNLEELGSKHSLGLIACVDFKKEDYPGYDNKRGAGARCDEPFPLGECSTFKFRFVPNLKKKTNIAIALGNSLPLQQLQPQVQRYSFFNASHLQFPITMNNNSLGDEFLPFSASISNECSHLFDGYFRNAVESFGRTGYDVGQDLQHTLKVAYARYTTETPWRDINGYIKLLQELHCLSISRCVWLQSMLANSGH